MSEETAVQLVIYWPQVFLIGQGLVIGFFLGCLFWAKWPRVEDYRGANPNAGRWWRLPQHW